jgi:Flp pilus assembly pilin Flp
MYWHGAKFCHAEDGAVTVDWVVLTAAVILLSIAVVGQIKAGATDISTGLGTRLSDATIQSIDF